ncbi:C-type isolectin Sp-CL4-like [Genypterus blacodes]|uniref:C-type isolectin Sp-CL4-like n=1 Tax=Genypterus blacodes TaxID=154954 RepID=UPI003F766132
MGHGWYYLTAGECFKLFCSERTFQEARARCQDDCGDLVVMNSLHKYNMVLCRLFKEDKHHLVRAWVGGVRTANGKFGWVDGSNFPSFTRWTPHQPDNARNQENCLEMNYNVWGHWNDLNCGHKRRFVCSVTLSSSQLQSEPSQLA